jgi:hypothetical protein
VTRIMYDAIHAEDLPPGGDLYAGYIDGDWPDADAIAARFPGKTVVRIATNPKTNDGQVGDGPPDNGTWAEWVGWAEMRRDAGQEPTINTDYALWGAGQAAFRGAGVAEPVWWVALYDGNAVLAAGEAAKQYASTSAYDTSVVADYWPGVDPVPTPAPVLEEEDMATCYSCPRSAEAGAPRDIFKLEGGKYLHVPGGVGDPSYGSMVAAGMKTLPISYELHVAQLAAYGGTAVEA